MEEKEFYFLAYTAFSDYIQKVTDAKDIAALKYNDILAKEQAKEKEKTKTPTDKKEK